MENRAMQTLGLFATTSSGVRHLTCTTQTSSGFHILAAAAGSQVVGSESVNLQSG